MVILLPSLPRNVKLGRGGLSLLLARPTLVFSRGETSLTEIFRFTPLAAGAFGTVLARGGPARRCLPIARRWSGPPGARVKFP